MPASRLRSARQTAFARTFPLLSLSLGLSLACGENMGAPITGPSMAGSTAGTGVSGAGVGGMPSVAGSSAVIAGGGGASGSPAAGGNGGAPDSIGGNGGNGGNSAIAGAAGGGGTPAMDACAAGPWTCIAVDGNRPYGTHTFDVPAQQNWVNTGLYLRAGQTATISESGTWQLSNSGAGIDHGPCKIGDLVARIGLYYKDPALTCVKGSSTFKAGKDGILFVGALAENDLGESYEARHDASGKKSVTIVSDAGTAPTVQAADAASFAFNTVTSGWVEVWGKHVILTLPVASAQKDAQVMMRATGRLDAIYELETELRSAVPHHGQRIRFFPDGTNPGYMLAGNPVRMAPTLVTGGDQTRISRAGETGTDIWGFAHEMGHDFSFAPNGFWTYQENTLESWPNLFAIYSLEKLGVPLNDSTTSCTMTSTGDYGTWDAWGGLCFLRQFQFRYGWDFYKKYFEQIKDTTSTGGDAWTFVHDEFQSIAGEDVTPLFAKWNVPHP